MPNFLKNYRKFKDIATQEASNVEKLARDYFDDGVSNSKIQEFMVEASKNDAWLSQFNSTLKLVKENEIQKFSKEDVQAQLEIMDDKFKSFSVEQKEQAIEKVYATTGSDTSGSNVAIDGILPTNILDVDSYLFNQDAGILNEVTIIRERGETQMPEFDVLPTASLVAEAAPTTPVNFGRRDGLDYKLNANIKVQVITEINELALRKGSPSYFAALRQAMVRGVSFEIAKQIFNGTNGTNQFHGILQSFTPATATNKRGSFDVTADTAIAAESNKFRKLVLMLGTLPSNLSDADMGDYMWVMNRNTWYQSIVPSLDASGHYYMDAVMKGIPVLMGPGGLPIKIVSGDAVPTGTAILAPMKKYFLNMPDGVELRDDGGIVNFNAGITLVKAFTFADGGYVRNFMRKSTWTTGADDNRDRNMWRVITGL